jgi:hypothetical protein
MALLTAERISALAVTLLARALVLPRTVLTVPGPEFSGPSGGTVTLRVPVPRTARVQATPGDPITFDPMTETPVPVQVTHIYDGTRLTDEDLSLNLEDFGRQVLMPQVEAVARRGEDELAAVMNTVGADDTLPADPVDPGDATYLHELEDAILAAGETLDNADVPAGDRWAAVSPSVARRLLRIDKFTAVDASGAATALRQAVLGSLYGFTFVKSNGLDSGTALLYHESAFAFGSMPPANPAGAAWSTTAEHEGLALRHIRQYNPTILSDESVVSLFAGATQVEADRTFKYDSGS